MKIKKRRLDISLESHLTHVHVLPKSQTATGAFDDARQYELKTTLILHFRYESAVTKTDTCDASLRRFSHPMADDIFFFFPRVEMRRLIPGTSICYCKASLDEYTWTVHTCTTPLNARARINSQELLLVFSAPRRATLPQPEEKCDAKKKQMNSFIHVVWTVNIWTSAVRSSSVSFPDKPDYISSVSAEDVKQ